MLEAAGAREIAVSTGQSLPGEGIPRVLLESMTAGMPVVTTRVSGIPSLITHEVNGLLMEDNSGSSVADAVTRVVTDSSLRQRLIANGYETARGRTLEAQAAKMMAAVAEELGLAVRLKPDTTYASGVRLQADHQ